MIRDAKIAGLVNRLVEHSPWMAMDVREYIEQIERRRDALLNLPNLVPTNWCDPLLTGPDSICGPPYDCRAIEKLLRGIQDRLRAAIADVEAALETKV